VTLKGQGGHSQHLRLNISTIVQTAAMGQISRSTEGILVSNKTMTT